MKFLATLLSIIGFCVATVGAAGFHARDAGVAEDGALIEAQSTEPEAWPLYLGGLAVFLLGVFVQRQARGPRAGGGSKGAGKEEFVQLLRAVKSLAVELDDARDAMDTNELRDRAEALTTGALFDLTSRHEELIALVGFKDYARVWDNVAQAERRLSRFWCMATDGHGVEGMGEISAARACIERAYEDMREL